MKLGFCNLSCLLVAALALAVPVTAAEGPVDPADTVLGEVTVPEKPAGGDQPGGGKARQLTPREVARLKAELKVRTDRLYHQALTFYRQREWVRCSTKCDEVLKLDPANLAAQRLKFRAEKAKIEHQLEMLEQESSTRDKEAIADVDRASNVPDKKRPLLRPVRPAPVAPLPLRVAKPVKSEKMLAMEQKLNQRVDINLIDVDLDFLMSVLQRISGVNIIADQGALKDKRLTVLVEDMPLREILKFIVRNVADIAYTVTADAVWVTSSGTSHPGMEPRIHALNVGLVSSAAMKGSSMRTQPRRRQPGTPMLPTQPGQPRQPGQQQQQPKTYLEEAIAWMEGWDDWPAGSSWAIDKMTSSLLVNTTPEMHEKISGMLALMDRPPVQVLISTRFITISANDLAELGLDFSLQTKSGQDIMLGAGSGTNLGASGIAGGLTAIVEGADTNPLFTATLRALETRGRGKVLSAPQIITLNNQKGVIDITTEFNYVSDWREVSTVDVTDEGQQIERVTNYVPVLTRDKVGFRLEVIPSVGRDLRHIILELQPTISDVEGGTKQFQTVQVLQLRDDETPPVTPQPVCNTKTLLTRLVVKDGGIVIIGGLMSQETTKSVTKVPVLGDIPLLGRLFRYTRDDAYRSHLVIVVKAQIIDPSGRSYTDAESGSGASAARRKARPIKGPWFTYPAPGTADGLGK